MADRHSRWNAWTIVRFALVALGFFLGARVGFDMPSAEGVLTPVWIPSALAVAAVIVWGRTMAVAVGVGSVFSSMSLGLSAPVIGGLALVDVGEPLVIAMLLRHFRVRPDFDAPREVLGFVAIAGALVPMVSAAAGTAVLMVAGAVQAGDFRPEWVEYYGSVAASNSVLAPLLLVLSTRPWRRWHARQWLTGGAAGVTVILVSIVIFEGEVWRLPSVFLLFPPLVWATVRLGAAGGLAGVVLVIGIAVDSMNRSGATLDGHTVEETIQVFQAALVAVAISNLFLAALLEERNRARSELSRSARRLETAQRVGNLGSWEADPDDPSRLHWTRELARMFQIGDTSCGTVDELVRGVHEEDRVRVRTAILHAIRNREDFNFDHRLVAVGETERTVQHGATAAVEVDGDSRVVGTVLDISERVAAEQLRGRMIATASHELRTPLAVLVGYAELLMLDDPSVDADQRRMLLERIHEQAERLASLVDDVLTQSRVDAGVVRVDEEPVDVTEVVEAAIEDTGMRADVTVTVDGQPHARVSRSDLQRGLVNLLENARKYGGDPIELRARAGQDRLVEITVSDGGPGVPRDEVGQVFRPYARGSDAVGVPGTGLGLSIVHGMARGWGGSLSYRRESGRTVFELSIPQA